MFKGWHRSAPPDCQASQQLVPQGLCLCNGTQAAVVDLLCVQLHRAVWELEPLLHHGCELPDSASLHTCMFS